METKTLIGILAAVVVVGGGAYLITRPATTGAPAQDTQATTTQDSSTGANVGAYTGSFADLAKRSGSWKCTIQSGTAQAVSSGAVHVSGGKVRGDFTSAVQGYGTVESHMISDGAYVYTWSSVMPTGYKFAVTASGNKGSTQTSGSGFDANQSYSYDCQPESADASLFTLPANVTFKAF